MKTTPQPSMVCAECERPLDPTTELEEARRMLVSYPKVDPSQYDAVRTENLLTSIAGSLLVIAESLHPRPSGSDRTRGGGQ